jgi:hypothetical protein
LCQHQSAGANEALISPFFSIFIVIFVVPHGGKIAAA